jgi:hypothetical protein
MMKALAKRVLHWVGWFGFDPLVLLANVRGTAQVAGEYRALKRQARRQPNLFPMGRLFLCVPDRYARAGSTQNHYFWQDLLVAQKIAQAQPRRHVDVGSRIDGFVAHVASFREIEVIDIRAMPEQIRNVRFRQADMMVLDPALAGCTDSLSCLHALEHFGLGRYGDPIDFQGYQKGFRSLGALLQPQGTLYFSVPIGPQRIEFNAHRVFSIVHLLALFERQFSVVSFSYVDDRGALHENVNLTPAVVSSNAGCKFGCGIFELRRASE